MDGDVRDMLDGMTEDEARRMAEIGNTMRECIASAPGADQLESRLRAFTLFASAASMLMGGPVVVDYLPTEDRLLQCRGDGTVKTLTVRDDGI